MRISDDVCVVTMCVCTLYLHPYTSLVTRRRCALPPNWVTNSARFACASVAMSPDHYDRPPHRVEGRSLFVSHAMPSLFV